jgi:DNA-binding transcriptional MerR regulator
VERATGLSREVLRKWELRYQFPRPTRGERGERQYSSSDVQRLQLISRLINSGLRAGALVPHSQVQLQNLLDIRSNQNSTPKAISEDETAQLIQSLLKTLKPAAAPSDLALFLQEKLQQHGLAVFVAHCLPVFNQAVGDAWLSKRLSVVAEHRYTDTVQQIVLRALPAPGHAHTRPRLLLTTPPGELHSLGLLALHAQLSLHGADCINLGTQAPLALLLQAARDMHVGVVAVSASLCLPLPDLRDYLSGLRAGLPPGCVLWAGGQGCTRLTPQEQADFNVMTDTASALQHWLTLAKAQRVAN